MESLIDLHVHSTCSDGSFSPEELVRYAIEKDLKAFALTDHDTIAGIARAQAAAAGTGLELIPGIELSAEYHKRDIHILGLGIDYEHEYFLEQLQHFQSSRDIRNEKMIAKLQEHGIEISVENMEACFPDCTWTRGNFARYLLDHGYVKSLREAFDRYLGDHAPCFVARERVTPYQAIQLIHEAGGYAILAHPLLYGMGEEQLNLLVETLTDFGLDGIEAIYSTNRLADESNVKQLAKRYGLAITGGSDFHGSNKPDIDLGCGKGNLKIPYIIWNNLKES